MNNTIQSPMPVQSLANSSSQGGGKPPARQLDQKSKPQFEDLVSEQPKQILEDKVPYSAQKQLGKVEKLSNDLKDNVSVNGKSGKSQEVVFSAAPLEGESIKKMKQILGSGVQEKPQILNFLAGNFQNLNADAVFDMISNNPFIVHAMSEDIPSMMQAPVSIEDLVKNLGFSEEQIQKLNLSGINLADQISPKDFFKVIGIDPHQVIAQLVKLKNELPSKGLMAPIPLDKNNSWEKSAKEQASLGSENANVEFKKKKNAMHDSLSGAQAIVLPQSPLNSMALGIQKNDLSATNNEGFQQVELNSGVNNHFSKNPNLNLVSELSNQNLKPTEMMPLENGMKLTTQNTHDLAVKDIDPFIEFKNQMSNVTTLYPQNSASQLDGVLGVKQSYEGGVTNILNTESQQSVLPMSSTLIASGLQPAKDVDSTKVFPMSSMIIPTNENANELELGIANLLGQTEKPELFNRESIQSKLFELPNSIDKIVVLSEQNQNFSSGDEKNSYSDKKDSETESYVKTNHGDHAVPHNIFTQNFQNKMHLSETIKPQVIENQMKFVDDVVKNAKILTTEGGGSAVINMSSPELGQLSLALKVEEDKVELRIITANEKAKHMISSEINRLTESLSSQNLNLKTVELSTADSSFSQRQDQNGQNFFFQQGQQSFQQQQSEIDKVIANGTAHVAEIKNTLKQKSNIIKTSFNPNSKIQVTA